MAASCRRPSTRTRPQSAINCPAASSSSSHMTGETVAPPQSATTATRSPRSSSRCVPSPSSQPSVRARLSGSRASWPLHTSNQRAVSRTDRDRQPTVTVRLPYAAIGVSGMRPNVLFRPTSPVKPAGIRIDPPPSPPVASVTRPPATAAAVPPDEPPGVCPCCHGLWVVPCRTVRVTLTPPNSDAVVWPTSTAPPRSRMRSTLRLVYSATRSLNGTDASVYGQPATWSSSLTPIGTPPNGRLTSARAAARSAFSRSRWQNAFRSLASIASYVAASSSTGERSPRRNASTREHASPCHVSIPMAADGSRRERRPSIQSAR